MVIMNEWDIHVAAQEDHAAAKAAFEKIGFFHDGLETNHVTFSNDQTSCPLIGIHMTRKFDSPHDMPATMQKVRDVLEKYNLTGYAHAEATAIDYSFRADAYQSRASWPLERFDAKSRKIEKKWDIHLAIPRNNTAAELEELLMESGMYHIDVRKPANPDKGRPEEAVYRVHTIQGVNSMQEGKDITLALARFLGDNTVPYADLKMERYLTGECAMFRVNNPAIVPPTIDSYRLR